MATGAPIPLGGTSNHIRREALVAVGAWDPWNVTEDADLGLRLARCGYRVAVLGSTTAEEAALGAGELARGGLAVRAVHLRVRQRRAARGRRGSADLAGDPGAPADLARPALAPLLVAVVVGAVLRPDRRRALALVAVPAALFGSVLAFEWASYLSGNLFDFLRYQITAIPLVVVLLGLALARTDGGASGRSPLRAVAGGLVVVAVLGAGAVTSGRAMLSEPIDATQEYRRVASLVVDAPDSALGMWASGREVAARIDAMDLPPASVLVDAGSGFAVVAASAHPERFRITSDDGFSAALADPPRAGIRVVLRNDAGGVDAVRARWGSFGTPASPSWVRPLGSVARATPFSYAWSLWSVTPAR